jgi:glycosyltransferase involved in cell wall biosynthesis
VDDGSKDRTVEIARNYGANDSRINVYINKHNLGDYPNRNRAASYASGEYILYVDSDDMIYTDTILYCVENMAKNPSADMLMIYNVENLEHPFLLQQKETIQKHFFEKPLLMTGPGGTFLKRAFFERIGKYPEKYGPANDMYFNLKAASSGTILFVPYVFVFYRRHEGQEINNKTAYLTKNYIYLNDAVAELDLGITNEQKAFILNKNKRRFIVNLLNWFARSLNFKEVITAVRDTKFSFRDFYTGIIH